MNEMSQKDFYFDPFSVEAAANLEGYYKEMRANHPVYYNEKYDTFFFSRFDDVWTLLLTPNNTFVATESNLPTPEYLSTHRNTNGAPPFASTNPMAQGNMLPSPYYEEMRLAHIAPLRPKAVAALANMVREQARVQLDEMLPRGKFDLSLDYAAVVPARMICHLYGLPYSIADKMMNHVRGLGSAKAGEKSIDISALAKEMRPYVLPLIAKRREAGADGSDGLIDGLINYRVHGERPLSDDEISNQLFCVMVGGLEAVPKIIARGIMELWRRPEQLAAVQADLDKNVPIAVEEIIRFCAPAVYTFRTCHRDVTIGGQPVKAGQRVVAMLNCASRDEREFPNPDEFIWNRSIPRVLSFGLGQHHCIGKHLALLEVRTLTLEFLKRVKDVEFFPDHGKANTGYFQRGYLSLPVEVKKCV
jgi:cytochrome P450